MHNGLEQGNAVRPSHGNRRKGRIRSSSLSIMSSNLPKSFYDHLCTELQLGAWLSVQCLPPDAPLFCHFGAEKLL